MATRSGSTRQQRSHSPTYKLDDESEAYEPYIPVIKRRQEKLAKLTSWSSHGEKDKPRKDDASQEHDLGDFEREDELRRERTRKERTLLIEAQEVHLRKAAEDAKKSAGEKAEEVDAEILEAIRTRKKLASDMELAKGIQYTEPLKTR
jgi:ATP-dependent RNA helicase DDX41